LLYQFQEKLAREKLIGPKKLLAWQGIEPKAIDLSSQSGAFDQLAMAIPIPKVGADISHKVDLVVHMEGWQASKGYLSDCALRV